MKKLISLGLTIAVAVTVFATSSIFAGQKENKNDLNYTHNTAINDVISGDSKGDMNQEIISPEEQVKNALNENNLSPEKRKALNEKLKIIADVNKTTDAIQKAKTARSVYRSSGKTLNVPYFMQENEYYCGPATLKQTLHFLTGSSPSQNTLANALGTNDQKATDGTRIVKYINNNTSTFYAIETNPSVDRVKAISERLECPQIGRVAFKKDKYNSWSYNTKGHYLNVSGNANNLDKARLTDPYIGKVIRGHSGHYYVTFNQLHQAINNHWAKHLYY